MIVIDVLGTPAPKGSNRAMLRGGFAVMVPGSSNVGQQRMKQWERCVRDEASFIARFNSTHYGPTFMGKPVAVAIVFRMPRPLGHTNKRTGALLPKAPLRPNVKPDVDKLARATLDALTGIVFDDDSRIVELALHKTYAEPGREGARIVVKEWTP
jgi:Holliday junction resolvase RusA-like endonuclease